MFWTIAFFVVLAAALAILWPLLRAGKGWWKTIATALAVVVPIASLYLYTLVGTPEAIDMPAPKPLAQQAGEHGTDMAGDLDQLTEGLRARLEANPDDFQGWLLLARSYKTVQRYPDAVEALQQAQRLAPDDPFVMVELVEAQLYASGKPNMSEEMISTLEFAVGIDPSQQKGLWLLGMAAAQSGDGQTAIEYWQQLLAQLEPGSPPALSVQSQIDEVSSRLGVEPAEPAPQEAAWGGIRVRVAPDSSADASRMPANAVLFVIARSPGGVPGPPLGVHRVINPQLPYEFTLNDAHAMTPGRLISAEQALELQARLSLSGSPTAAPGDWQSTMETVEISVDSQSSEIVELSLLNFEE
jgi:cytochrome c-type biogenesis protein CcmH